MADSVDKSDQEKDEEIEMDDKTEEMPPDDDKNKEISPTFHLLEKHKVEDEQNKICDRNMEEGSTEKHQQDSGAAKVIDERDETCNVEHESEEDSSKRQKLNEDSSNVSTNQTPQEDSTYFRKYVANFKNRNYRAPSNSSDQDEASNPTEQFENDPGMSSSSDDVDLPQNSPDVLAESSDGQSDPVEDNGDSNDWTTASEDDLDELPGVLLKEPSKSDWSIAKDVLNREIGSNNYIQRRFYSSLHAVQRLELMYKLEEHTGCVNALGFNQKGNLLASASDDLTITIWDWAIGKKHIVLQTGHRSNVFQSKWLPFDTECFVVSCARDGQVRLIDVRTSVTRKIAQHRAACHKISTHLDLPQIILSAGEDSKVFSIDVRENKPTRLLSMKDNDQEVELYSIHSNPLNNYEFCVAGRTRTVRIYDRRKPSTSLYDLCPKHLLTDELAHITCAVYNHNGTEILASYNNEDIYLFDTSVPYQSGDFAHKYQGHRNSATVKGVNFFGPNSEFILSGSDCGNIFIWDKKTEAIVQWMPGDEQGIVNALEPHPHIPILATSGLDHDVKIWIPSREETPNIKQQLQSCVKKNLAARARSAGEAESAFAGHVLWIVLRHARQAERRRHLLARRGNRNLPDNDSDIDIDDDEDDDDDDDDEDFNFNYDDNSTTSNENSSDSDAHSEN